MPAERYKQSSYINAPRNMMSGPSMDTAGLAMSLAQQLMGSSPAMGGIGASTGAMNFLGGPAGMIMGIPMKVLGNLSNQSQEAINAFTGMPNPLRKDPMRELDSMLTQYFGNPNNAPAVGQIGTATPLSQGGQIGAMNALAGVNPGAQVAAMRMLGGTDMEHLEPDEDQAGGKSDRDADNYTPQMGMDAVDAEIERQAADAAARSAVGRMSAASPMASARPIGGFRLGGAGQLAAQLRNAGQPQDNAMRLARPYRPEMGASVNESLTSAASIPPMRMSSVPTAASYVGQRQPPVSQTAVQDIMSEPNPQMQTRMRARLMRQLSPTGGGY